jgi:TRAP-type C4-dicarboxylate transport system substrate-binding protein
MKIQTLLLIALACCPSVAVAASPVSAPALRIATVAPAGSSFHKQLLALGAEWSKGPGGVRMDVYPGTQGGESQIVRRLRIGQIQGAMLTVVGLADIDRSVTALQYMPMMFRDWHEVDIARDRVRVDLERRLESAGYVLLFWGDAGWVRYFSNRPVRRPADLMPMRVFASTGEQESVQMLSTYYKPVPLDPDKLLLGLRNGMIDAVPMPAFLANFSQVPSYAPYMLDLKWSPIVGALVISKPVWDALDSPTRDWLRVTSERAGHAIRAASRAQDDAAIVAMRDRQGLTVTTLTPQELEEWRVAVTAAYPAIRERLVPADTFDQVVSALAAHRAALGTPR